MGRVTMTTIYTIGYEATTMADLLAALTQAGVRRVIDVRALRGNDGSERKAAIRDLLSSRSGNP